MTVVLETPRLRLRQMIPGDAQRRRPCAPSRRASGDTSGASLMPPPYIAAVEAAG